MGVMRVVEMGLFVVQAQRVQAKTKVCFPVYLYMSLGTLLLKSMGTNPTMLWMVHK